MSGDLSEIQIEYGGSCVKYEKLVSLKLRNDDVIIISGYGCSLRVKGDALEVFPGKTHKDQIQETVMLYRGVHHTRQIVMIGYKGLVMSNTWYNEQRNKGRD